MILGLSTPVFTAIHVAISLIAIATGFLLFFGFARGKFLARLSLIFLITTALTSLTGFAFPNSTITPGVALGILSMFVLIIACVALYVRKLAHAWRGIYIFNAGLALFFNTFVLVAQTFEHTPGLMAYQKTPVFLAAQIGALIVVGTLIFFAMKNYKGTAFPAA
jgi:hypothetical protein